jgi:hypothetical protein
MDGIVDHDQMGETETRSMESLLWVVHSDEMTKRCSGSRAAVMAILLLECICESHFTVPKGMGLPIIIRSVCYELGIRWKHATSGCPQVSAICCHKVPDSD